MFVSTSQTKGGLKGNTQPLNSKRIRARRFVLTLNNWTNEEFVSLSHRFQEYSCSWVIGFEKGERGTKHLQGYFECPNQLEYSTIKKWNNRMYFTKALGNKKQNIDYCTKSGKFEGNIKGLPVRKVIYSNEEFERSNPCWNCWWHRLINSIKTFLCIHKNKK